MEKILETKPSEKEEIQDFEIIDPFSPSMQPFSPLIRLKSRFRIKSVPLQATRLVGGGGEGKKKSKRKHKDSSSGASRAKPKKPRKSRSKKPPVESKPTESNPLDFRGSTPALDKMIDTKSGPKFDEADMLLKLSMMIRDSLGFALDKLLKGNGAIHSEFKADELLATLIQKDISKYSTFMSNRAQMLICSGVDIGKGYSKKIVAPPSQQTSQPQSVDIQASTIYSK